MLGCKKSGIVGVGDRFRFEQHAWRGDLYQPVECLNGLVGARQVLAGRVLIFPDECHGIETQDVDAGAGDEEHFF